MQQDPSFFQKITAGLDLSSLRVRLAASMLAVLAVALLLSTLLDKIGLYIRNAAPALLRPLASEPTQDGLVLASFGLVVATLIWLVSAWSLRPLQRAAEQAAQAGPSKPGVRIDPDHLPAEIRPLVTAMNGALDRLEAAVEAERRFTADAAHELRTPLAVLTLRLQQARREAAPDWNAADRDIAHMTRLVTQLLDLARKEASARGQQPPEPVNLARCARAASALVLALAECAGRSLVVELPEHLPMQGHAADLEDMIVNLLENALHHGQGTITLSARTEAGRHILTIADQGPALDASLRAVLFERFRKASQTSSGTGLGLAIVRQVVQTHGGSVRFLDTSHCQVMVELPASSTSLNRVMSATGLPSSSSEMTST